MGVAEKLLVAMLAGGAACAHAAPTPMSATASANASATASVPLPATMGVALPAPAGLPALYVPWPQPVASPAPAPALPVVARPAEPVIARPADPVVIRPSDPAVARPAPVAARPAPALVPRPVPTLQAAMPATVVPASPAAVIPIPAVALPLSRPAAATPAVARSPAPITPTPVDPAEGVISHAVLSLPSPLPPSAVEEETARLRAALRREVPGLTVPDAAHQHGLVALAQAAWRTNSEPFDHAQLIVVVDRNPRVQQVSVVLARPDGPWEMLGAAHVSTGEPGRFDHYITPTGVFLNTADILGYRAEGTYNENHIRGLGVKGMRVWDFGWQTARKGWRSDGQTGPMRLEMHATDPEILAQRIGRPASQGCIRIPDALNRFLDRHGVLDADYERAAIDDVRYRALLLPNRVATPLAGHALVVVDSGGQA